MLPITKILWPTDFSEPSYEALKVADEMALHFSAELIITHVVTPIPVIPIHSRYGPSSLSAVPGSLSIYWYPLPLRLEGHLLFQPSALSHLPVPGPSL